MGHFRTKKWWIFSKVQVPSCGLMIDICAVAGGLAVSILRRLQLGCSSRSGSGCTTANKNNEISHSILTTRIRFMVTSFCFSIADSTLLSPSIQCSMMLFFTLKSDKLYLSHGFLCLPKIFCKHFAWKSAIVGPHSFPAPPELGVRRCSCIWRMKV